MISRLRQEWLRAGPITVMLALTYLVILDIVGFTTRPAAPLGCVLVPQSASTDAGLALGLGGVGIPVVAIIICVVTKCPFWPNRITWRVFALTIVAAALIMVASFFSASYICGSY